MQESYPLQWPIGRNRTSEYTRKHGMLNKMPSGRIRQLLFAELRKMSVTSFVVSSNVAIRKDGLPYANQRQPDDPGVVLYFTRKGVDIAIACDTWTTTDANLRAIGLTIEAIRGMERWGTEEMVDRAFTGFKALPEAIITPLPRQDWFDFLGVQPTANRQEIKRAYQNLAKAYHPDSGGSNNQFVELTKAYNTGMEQANDQR
jgi:hypothetical protein